ncbi:LamG domain-containing protein, partial [Candidatus Pacearchaeota archaeon]|nr:LamG domain-containing protein [Candidatus Pacearchaeota archaeon]
LQFTCYDASGGGTPTTDVDSIRLVKVDTTLTNSAALGNDKTFSTAAYLRTNWYPPSVPVLIGRWKLDEDSGQSAADSSDNSNDGQLGSSAGADSSDPIWISDPTKGNVLSFDGSDDYVAGIGNCPTNDYTVAVWAKDTGPISGGKWSVVYSAEQEIWLGVDRGASASIWIDVGGNGKGAYTAAGTWTRHVWHHVAATWDGSTIHLYLDGVDMPIKTYGKPEDAQAKAAVIGTWAQKPKEETWAGLLSDVHLYDEALTAEEIVILIDDGWKIAP